MPATRIMLTEEISQLVASPSKPAPPKWGISFLAILLWLEKWQECVGWEASHRGRTSVALLSGKSRSWSGSFGGPQGEQAHLCKEALCQGESDLLLIHGSDLCHVGGGSRILLRRLTGTAGGAGQGRGTSTAVAVLSWASICPPSMCSVPSPPHLDSQAPYMCCL